MNIFIFTNNSIGLYKFRKELIQELLSCKYQIHIGLPNGPFIDQLKKAGCKFYNIELDRRSLNLFKDFILFIQYINLIKQVKPDLVITYTIKPNLYAGLASFLLKKKLIINITGLGYTFQKKGILRRLIVLFYRCVGLYAKMVFFENQENYDYFLSQKMIKRSNSFVLNGAGVNLDEFTFHQYPNQNEIRFLFIGRIMKEKGIDELFEVADMIKKKYSNVFFDVLGSLEEKYQTKVQKLINNKIIHYYGFQYDVKPFITKAHCIVLPSYHEGMSNALLEAGAMGRPIITSNIPGCKETVIVNMSGYLVKKGSIDDLYEKIVQFINLPNEEKMNMGVYSRKHIESHFSKNHVVYETIKRVKQCC